MVSKRHEGGMSGLGKGLHQFSPTKHASKPPISGHKQGLCTCTQGQAGTGSNMASTHDSHSIAPAHATMHDMHARADYARIEAIARTQARTGTRVRLDPPA